MVLWGKERLNDDKFKVSYRYNGIMREATIEELRLSDHVIYRMRNKLHWWDLEKKNGSWRLTTPHPLPAEVIEQIGNGIDAWIKKRGY